MDVWPRKQKILWRPHEWRWYRSIFKPKLAAPHFIIMEDFLALLFAQDILALPYGVIHSILGDCPFNKSRRQLVRWISHNRIFESYFSCSAFTLFVVGVFHRISWNAKRNESLLFASLANLWWMCDCNHPLLFGKNGNSIFGPYWFESRGNASSSRYDCLGHSYPEFDHAKLSQSVRLLGNIRAITQVNHDLIFAVGCHSCLIRLVAVIDVLCFARQ
jgi:hypothetical protein